MPFAPTFDTVGILARSADVLRRASEVLLAGSVKIEGEPPTIHLLDDAFALADAELRQALDPLVDRLRALYGQRVRSISLKQICGDGPGVRWETWLDTYCVLQWSEIRSSLGAWIAANNPQFGPATAGSFKLVHDLDRTRARAAIETREACYRALRRVLVPRDLLCIPTVPNAAPAKASHAQDRTSGYYRNTLSLTALGGIGRLPQVSMPLARTPVSPVGLSLIAAQGEDLFLVGIAEQIGRELGERDK
jgi:amidase